MNGLILPGQQPSREIMKATADLLSAVINQNPGMALGIKSGFKVQIANNLDMVLFSLEGDIQHARPLQGGIKS